MNITSVITGLLVLLYGLFILVTRFTRPYQHSRLSFLTKVLGYRWGTLIHTIVYIIAPFALAAWLISHGLEGESLKQIFTPPPRP